MLKNKAGFRKTSFLIYGLTLDFYRNGNAGDRPLRPPPPVARRLAEKHEPREATGFAGLE